MVKLLIFRLIILLNYFLNLLMHFIFVIIYSILVVINHSFIIVMLSDPHFPSEFSSFIDYFLVESHLSSSLIN